MPVDRPQQFNDERLGAVVRAAGAGDNDAWTQLIARYERRVRAIARSYRLQPSDVDDVVQMTWMRLYEHIKRLREPAAIAGWLATTTRREAMRLLQNHVREQLTDDPNLGDVSESDLVEAHVLAAEDRLVLRRAIAVLPGRERELMDLLATQPDADYAYISTTLAMPVGSIGPTRARGLQRLRLDPTLRAYHLSSARPHGSGRLISRVPPRLDLHAR